ncbi:hypothetical protein A2U01_0070271, partial [Trifolium medium]|nr:hypothetical protein [Trifolium medium]
GYLRLGTFLQLQAYSASIHYTDVLPDALTSVASKQARITKQKMMND